jgi:hypothetical protein
VLISLTEELDEFLRDFLCRNVEEGSVMGVKGVPGGESIDSLYDGGEGKDI